MRTNIDWAQLCELAFIDRFGRLCLIGITERFAVPSLPLAVRQLMIAVRISGIKQGEVLPIGVSMNTPGGRSSSPSTNGYEINVVNEYALITLWDIPLTEEGTYRFSVYSGDADPYALVLAVTVLPQRHQNEQDFKQPKARPTEFGTYPLDLN